MVEKYRNYIENISKETGFIQSTLEKVEILIKILEWINSDEKLNSYPSSILIDGVYGSYVLDCYRCNKYEEEDEYFAFDDVT